VTVTGSMIMPRDCFTATLLPNGQVLAAAGSIDGAPDYHAELFNPATGTWSAAANENIDRLLHTATLLTNGTVLVAGGYDGASSLTFANLYAPSADTWTGTGRLNTGRTEHTATLLANGQVLVAGGVTASGGTISGYLSSAELFTP
jgi:N-acetylneuraminic acid mutarotase